MAMTENGDTLMKRTLAALTLLTTAGFTLTACGDDSGSDATGTSASPSASATAFNAADVSFAQQMIPHHQQAVEMAQLAEGRAESDDVKELAEDIKAAQGPEIETLTGWLEAWGEEVPSDDMGHGGMGHGSDDDSGMSGMMDAEQMNDLTEASGAEFDSMFLELMVEHHEGAVEMAQSEIDQGENSDAIAMAEKVISDQQSEIEHMQQLLGS